MDDSPTETREAAICPRCGAPNDPRHRFCASCGFKLGGAGEAATADAGENAPRLVALNPDGSEGVSVQLATNTTVGRSTGGLFAQDLYLSPAHATIAPQADHVMVTDADSLNGVYRRLLPDRKFALTPMQMFRIGQELIQFEYLEAATAKDDSVEYMGAPVDGYVGRIAMVLGRDTTGTAFPIPETGLNLGRERGEVLFSDDGYVSGLHCRLSFENGQVYLTDLGSSNGTFVRIRGTERFDNGDVLLMGQQLFRIAF
ncbi:MAG: FHA domain-containing protein [Myxococcota bacterium]